HYPANQGEKEAAERRFAFDDLLLLQIGLGRRRLERSTVDGIAMASAPATLAAFRAALPFALTGAQQRALAEIEADLARPRPMARLLQGDVGSGKTAVAAAAMLIAKANSYQSAMLAPTQVLAEQHERGLRSLFEGLPDELRPQVELLTGNTQAKARRQTLAAVAAGEVDILVGTHALLEEAVGFARLGLTVVDEQHRFGVRQRATLPDKATGKVPVPHLLSMTATPIPRTLNQVLHGDIEVSVIPERPPGRTPVETRRYVGRERDEAYALVRQQAEAGRQIFVICPLVEASEATEAKAAVEEAARLQAEVFPDLRIATLHGRMSGKEKDRVMTAFRDRAYDILVSTSVIEVGIDVPNATVMLIEGADRFGLAQLHQFRGRVGRGGGASWCLLLADDGTPQGEERLRMMVETDDGFALAEKDLELRGPGDFIGTRQSGLPEMSWIDGAFDVLLLDRARRIADDLLERDPDLSRPEHRLLGARLEAFWKRAAPDVAV
ncbi:MAG: ATP-dependent DNA helicase RecG, partial [Chloroflexia bacterium]|nr:ATP-dependent DNA helicase RecG [Chloroflexia bacterium]